MEGAISLDAGKCTIQNQVQQIQFAMLKYIFGQFLQIHVSIRDGHAYAPYMRIDAHMRMRCGKNLIADNRQKNR